MIEKQVSYTATNSYCTLNKRTEQTQNIWLVFHGIGYLSRFFLRHFEALSVNENYIIAPQAPSKYYLNSDYKHVGASWLTKENTREGIENVIAYINEVCAQENIFTAKKLYILGYSQGVSIAARWLAKNKINCSKLILYAGGIPQELTASDFAFLKDTKCQISTVVGNKDPYLTPERLVLEREKINAIFPKKVEHIYFNGGHEVKKEVIQELIALDD